MSVSNLQKNQIQSGNPNEAEGEKEKEEASLRKLLEEKVTQTLQEVQQQLDFYTKNDKDFKKKDTIEVVIDLLKKIQQGADEINKQSEQIREQLYYLTFNSTVLIFKICTQLRRSGYARVCTQFLAFSILCLDNNLILTTGRYLEWRVMYYIEAARSYNDYGAIKAALKVIGYGIQKVLYLKQIEEQDPPVPEGTKDALVEALRNLRTQELKYQLLAGVLTPEAWKKKIEETFSQNKYHRSLAIIECLTMNDTSNCHLIARNSKYLPQKTSCLKLSLDFVRSDIELVKQALIQIHEKKKRDLEKKDVLGQRQSTMGENEVGVNVDEILEKYKILDNEMIKEKDWKFASYNVPIEVHVNILMLLYECKLWQEFDQLLEPALVRLKFRRYEVPYLATIDVLMSQSKVANIPNGFEKIPKDLNVANLRIELKKLRQQAKKDGGTQKQTQANKDQQKKKQEEEKKKKDEEEKKKQAAQKQPANQKGGKADPKQQQQQQEIPKDEEDDNMGLVVNQDELDQIKHVYVSLLLQRTKNSQNAIVGMDIVLADENVGPELPENHFAVAVPIRQHQGVYDKTGLIPYVIFRRTANSLIDEEDCLSVITDVCIIMGQDRQIRAPLGYQKINFDLRQTPEDLERIPNLDYVYLCYKTDKSLIQTERDLLIFRRLADLEKSYFEKSTNEFKSLDEYRQYLSLNFNMEMLVDLSRTIKEALLGPLGDHYLQKRQDILYDISYFLFQKYLLPTLQRIDVYCDLRNQKEYSNDFVETMDELVLQVKNQIVEGFNVLHRILTRLDFIADMVFYCKVSVYLANILEDCGEFRNAVQILRSSQGKVIEYREEKMKSRLDQKDMPSTIMSITIDNKKIGEIEDKIDIVYSTWEGLILRKERDRERKDEIAKLQKKGIDKNNCPIKELDEQEGDEEQEEFQRCFEELKNKDLFEKNINVEEWRKEDRERNKKQGKKYYNEQEEAVISLHCDILVNLYRCEIKLGKEMNVVKSQTNKLLLSQGIDLSKNTPGNMTKNLSTSLKTKMNQKTNKTIGKSKNDLQNLKQTLQEAGKLPPPKPQIQPYEKILEKENNQNPYQNALLNMILAFSKSNIVEQKSLLLLAQEQLKKAKQSEEQLANLSMENAVYIRASQYHHHYFKNSPDSVHPFSLLAKPQYIKKTQVPQKPIFLGRTSTSLTLVLPYFRPITEYKSWRDIDTLAVYGKPSGSGVAVSLNNIEYEGTGNRQKMGAIHVVQGLIPNERYVFASGAYTYDGICVNGIGETSNEILTLHPLSLHQIGGYLVEIAFKLGHYQIAKQVAEELCSEFIIKDEYKCSYLDSRINPILAFKLNYNYIKQLSLVDLHQIALSFFILSQVSLLVRNDVQKKADFAELKVEAQKIEMKICNYLIIALDIACFSKDYQMIKKCVAEVYKQLSKLLKQEKKIHLLYQVLIKTHQSIRMLPQELIDSNIRKVMNVLSYQILKIGFETQEEDLVKRLMISEIPLNFRKWRKFAQYVIRRPQLTEEQKLKQEEQRKRIELGEKIAQEDLILDPEPYEERLIKADEFEEEGRSYEEFLLSLIDYQDVVKAKTERWKLQINRYQKTTTNGNEQVEKLKENIQQVVEFWEGIKLNNSQAQLTIILTQQENNQRYLEFSCKCIRRSMELSVQSFTELEEILVNKIKIQEDYLAPIETKINERIEYLSQDIVRKQRKRFAILEERVKQIQDSQSSTNPSKKVDIQKLQDLMNLNEEEVDENQALMQYETEEDEKRYNYVYLWLSEKLFLQGICQFLTLGYQAKQNRQSCQFNEVATLDFDKFKSALDEYLDIRRLEKERFEEENKSNNDQYVLKIDPRVTKISNFIKVMSRAAFYAKNSRSWIQLENIIRYTWNVLLFDLTTPFELKETECVPYILVLAECSLFLVEYLKSGGQYRQQSGMDLDQVKGLKKTLLDKEQKTVAFQIQSEEDYIKQKTGINPNEQSTLTLNSQRSQTTSGNNNKAKKWFERIDNGDFDIQLHVSYIAYTVQCLMAVKKWESLVDLSNRINAASENQYAQQLLPFIIQAQQTLFESALFNTKSQQNALTIRIQQFENWKLTNKKKRSRQAMITGEIPVEEQEFLKDKASLEKEIFRLEIIENVLLSDKQQSQQLLNNINRDANNCEEMLKQYRKQYFQFGIYFAELQSDIVKKGALHFEVKMKKKNHKIFTQMVISNYRKCIEELRKRQENFMLIQALHEMGNLLYSDGQIGEAEIQWNDCVDTIFQRLYVVNSWRQVFQENPQLASKFGSKQCLIGGIVLIKLAKLCYEGRDQFRLNECLQMAADMMISPAKLTMPHPQSSIEYSSYSFKEYLGQLFFTDTQLFHCSDLISSLDYLCHALYDCEMYEKIIPLACLMEYIGADITKSKVIVIKARLLKAIAMCEIGYINETYQLFNRIVQLKDLPKNGQRQSEITQKKDGKNFSYPLTQRYHNHLTPESEKNLEAIQVLLKPLSSESITQLKKVLSPYQLEILQFLRSLLLVRIGESENVEMPEKSDFRLSIMKAAEEQTRTGLKNLGAYEEILYLNDKLSTLERKEVDINQEEISDTKSILQKVFEANNIPNEDDQYYKNKEEEQAYPDLRISILNQILRGRQLLGRIYIKQGFLSHAFYILKQGLNNFKGYCEGRHNKLENGQENEDKGVLKIPDLYNVVPAGTTQAPPANPKESIKKQAPPPKDDKKGNQKGQQQNQAQEEEMVKKLEKERKERELQEEQNERDKVLQKEKREHPHIYLWLKIKCDIVRILLSQRRYEDCADTIVSTNLECKSLNDQLFSRQLLEVQFQMLMLCGEIEHALEVAENVRKIAKAYSQKDRNYQIFLGNLSEVYYSRDRSSNCLEYIKEGRLLVWYTLRDYGLELEPQNINEKIGVKVNKERTKITEEVLAQYQTQIPAAGKGQAAAKNPPAKAANQKGGNQAQQIEDLPIEEEKPEEKLIFSTKLQYQLDNADHQINNSQLDSNIYIKNIELVIRYDIKYSLYLSYIEQKHDLAKKVLGDTEKLLKRSLHISPQLKFQLYFLSGQVNLNLFFEKLLQFQEKFDQSKKKYKEFWKHVPYSSIALNKFILDLPQFSENLKKFYKDYLDWAKRSFKLAIDIGKQEFIKNEFEFSIVDAFKGMALSCLLISEYRIKVLDYKYANYKERDMQRKIQNQLLAKREQSQIDDNLLIEEIEKELSSIKDGWEEEKLNREKLEIANNKKLSIYYMEQAITASKQQREFVDKSFQLGQVNLTDPSKIPKEVAWEIFEQFQVAKVNYVKIPHFDPKDKANITSIEILSYIRSLLKELEFMTFSDEQSRLSKMLSKLHRYLKLNLATYVQKCIIDQVKEPDEIKDPNQADTIELIKKGQIYGIWSDFKNQKSTLIYIIGPIEDALGQQLANSSSASIEYHQKMHFGQLFIQPLALSALYQDTRDLIDKMKASEKLSQSQNERDRRKYRTQFNSLIERFGSFFKAPISTDQDLGKEVNVLELIREWLPDLTIENVDKFGQLLQKETGTGLIDPKLNLILRIFHSLRYVP